MALRRKAHRFFSSAPTTETDFGEELNESDIWGFLPADHRMSIPTPSGLARKNNKSTDSESGSAVGSLPVKIPDWSKGIRGRQFFQGDGSDDEDGEGAVIPPHELLWRSRAASFSVQEGIGRTLKGRDLSRVRDSIWLSTGFED